MLTGEITLVGKGLKTLDKMELGEEKLLAL